MANEVERSGGQRSLRYPAYVLVILLLAYILSFMDRIALSLFVGPIQKDLGLGDTAMGLLIGFAFVLLYSTVGVVVGRRADTGDRRRLILAGMLIWSVATATCGFATGFVSLMMARIFVGLGESTLSPASYSLIASYFPPERLGIAASIYALGLTLGGGVATTVIGLVAHYATALPAPVGVGAGTDQWRTTFVVIGALGLPFFLLMLTVREPRRTEAERVLGHHAPGLGEVCDHLVRRRAVYVPIILGYAIMAIPSLGLVAWGPTFFIRVHGYTTTGVGALFGMVWGGAGTIGVLSGGWLMDRLTRRGMTDAAPRIVVASLVLQTPLFLIAYLANDVRVAVGTLVAAVFCMALQGGLQGATMALMAPPRMRGLVTATYLMLANIFGFGVGALAIALLTERVFARPEAVGQSLAIVATTSALLAGVLIAKALPAFREHIAQRNDVQDHGPDWSRESDHD